MRRTLIASVTLLFLFIIIFIGIYSVSGRTIVVDEKGTGDYTTIQDAIDNANNDDEIYVKNGNYYETIRIINKTISLVGEDKSNTILDGEKKNHVVYLSNANNTSICGFTIKNAGGTGNDCIIVYDSTNVTIGDNTIKDSSDSDGVSLVRSKSSRIENNLIESNPNGNGIILARSSNNTLYGNIIENNQKGIFLQYFSCDNIISYNSINSNELYGIEIWAASDKNLLFKNQFSDNGENAYDTCTNLWYNQETHEGNYWDDYSGKDADGDGIGDTPYDIPGGNNQDIYVLGIFEKSSNPTKNNPPIADAGGPYNGVVNISVSFDGSGSYDRDGSIVYYHWEFGDGTAKDGIRVIHRYESPGNYTVRLTVKDNGGKECKDVTEAHIVLPSVNIPPIADAGGPYTGYVGVSLLLNASKSYDPDGSIVNYIWNFGDGKRDFGITVQHTYQNKGIYNISLEVVDSNGSIAMAYSSATIRSSGESSGSLLADAGGPYSGDAGSIIEFNASSSRGNIELYVWDFGDGTNMTTENSTVLHSYDHEGVYNVTLRIKDGLGDIAEDRTTAVVGNAWKKNEAPGFNAILLLISMFLVAILLGDRIK